MHACRVQAVKRFATSLLTMVFVASLVTPMALAQDNLPAGVCGPLTADLSVPPVLTYGETGTVSVTVTNTGNLAAAVTAAADLAAQGWSISGQPSASGDIGAGSSTTFTFTVRPADGAATSASFNVAVSATCQAPGGVGCPAGCEAATVNTSGSLSAQAPPAEGLFGLDESVLPVAYALGAGLLLIAGIGLALALRRRQVPAIAHCAEPLKMLRPGLGTSFPLTLRNASQEPLKVRLELGAVPAGWSAFMPVPDVQLAAGETRHVHLMVRSPADAVKGQAADVLVRITDGRRPEPLVIKMRAEIDPSATPTGGPGARPASG